MTKHIVFFIHGMGKHDNTWHEAGLTALKEAWGEFDNLGAFDDQIEAIPVVYDDVFETWRQKMTADFNAFKTALFANASNIAPEDQGQIQEIQQRLDTIGGWIGVEDNFVWTHAMDVILYRFFTNVRMPVDVSVVKQMLNRIKNGGFKSWSVVAHSLGTSVAHNCLNSLYSAGLDGVAPLDPNETRPRTVMMVSNVSRVLERPGAQVFDSRVKPGAVSTGRLCGYYLNIRHKLDPFTMLRPFERDPWPDATTFATDRYQHIRPGHIMFPPTELATVHDFAHYLVNPRVHVPLFRTIMGKIMISDEEFRDEKSSFDTAQNGALLDQARAALEPLLPAPGGSWSTFIEIIKQLK